MERATEGNLVHLLSRYDRWCLTAFLPLAIAFSIFKTAKKQKQKKKNDTKTSNRVVVPTNQTCLWQLEEKLLAHILNKSKAKKKNKT